MIQGIRLQNFKAIRDVEVELERLTVFVGPNGSGKTSILQGLNILIQTAGSRSSKASPNLPPLLAQYGYSRALSEADLELSCQTNANEFYLHFIANKNISSGFDCQFRARSLSEDYASQSLEQRQKLASLDVKKELGQSRMFRFDASRMAAPSSGTVTLLADDGTGLASVLAFMALNQPDNFVVVQRELTRIVPPIARIRFTRSNAGLSTQESIIFDTVSRSGVASSAASEGTLLILGMLTALVGEDCPELVLLDDIDRGFHPLAQRNVVSLLRKVLERRPTLQIVATTHSPYLLDSLRPEEVRMTTLNDDGSVACGRLVDHPKFDQWKNEMAPGEMWSMFGEKWVSQSPAQAAETI